MSIKDMTVNAAEAATRLSVNEKTIRLWIASGKLKAKKALNGRWAINVNEIERITAEHAAGSTENANDG